MIVTEGGTRIARRNRQADTLMELFYCSDLHGDEAQYERLDALAGKLRPQVVILGGDMLPDDSALDPKTMGRGQPAFVRDRFRTHVASIREKSGCREVLCIFGNHDWGSSVSATKELEKEGLLKVLEPERPVSIDGLNFLGYSCTPPTPWFVKDFERLDIPGDRPPLLGGARWDARFGRPSTHGATYLYTNTKTIADDMAELKPPADPWVFVAHSPPHASKLDRFYDDQAWGSKAIRAAIEKHQPLLSLHGHIHESPDVSGDFQDRLGKTVAVNPGQSRTRLQYAVIEIDVSNQKVIKVTHGHSA